MKLNYSKKIFIVTGLCLVLIFVLNFVLAKFLFAKIVRINDKTTQMVLLNKERETNLLLKDSLGNSKVERSGLEEYFIGADDAQTPQFISELEALADKANLKIEIKSVNYENNSNVASSVHFRVNVVGKWNDVFGFIQTIETLPKATMISSVSLSTSSNLKSANKDWSADLDFLVAKLNN